MFLLVLTVLLVTVFFLVVIILTLNSPKTKGFMGEFRVANILKSLDSEKYKILNDVIIQTKSGKTAQIDHIVVSIYGIFVIKKKNYKGWIFGNENAENWLQVIYKEKHRFRNPVKQNISHVYALRDALTDFPNIKYFPIVVFSGNAELKQVESAVPVIYSSQLNSTIQRLSVSHCLPIEELSKVINILENRNIENNKNKKAHIQAVQNTIFENQQKKENLTCPRCNANLKLRKGKYGEFYGCANYPRCTFTMSISHS